MRTLDYKELVSILKDYEKIEKDQLKKLKVLSNISKISYRELKKQLNEYFIYVATSKTIKNIENKQIDIFFKTCSYERIKCLQNLNMDYRKAIALYKACKSLKRLQNKNKINDDFLLEILLNF